MTTRSSIFSLLVDSYDWTVDALRILTGREPRPPVATEFGFDRQPIAGVPACVELNSRRTEYAHLSIWQSSAKLFDGGIAARGTVGFTPHSAGDLQLRLCLESRFFDRARRGHVVQEAIIPCLEQGPPIEKIVAPRRVRLGDFGVLWDAPAANRVRLAVIENGEVSERELAPVGQVVLHPPRPGQLVLRFAAESRWGTTYATRHVDILPPKLKLDLLTPALQTGMPGQKVRFEWRIEGACEAWIVAPARHETLKIAFEQVLETRFGLEPEEFRIVARPSHGRGERTITIKLVPSPFACLGAQH